MAPSIRRGGRPRGRRSARSLTTSWCPSSRPRHPSPSASRWCDRSSFLRVESETDLTQATTHHHSSGGGRRPAWRRLPWRGGGVRGPPGRGRGGLSTQQPVLSRGGRRRSNRRVPSLAPGPRPPRGPVAPARNAPLARSFACRASVPLGAAGLASWQILSSIPLTCYLPPPSGKL